MQDFFYSLSYARLMATKSRLRELRGAAGLSQRELAKEIGERQSNIQYWEETGKPPRSELLIPIAKALGVSLEELLGEPKSKRIPLGGRVRQLFEAVAKLPRRQQDKVFDILQPFVKEHINGHGKAA